VVALSACKIEWRHRPGLQRPLSRLNVVAEDHLLDLLVEVGVKPLAQGAVLDLSGPGTVSYVFAR
jgi:hypothetical protein